MRGPQEFSNLEAEARLTAAMRALAFPTSRAEAVARVGAWPLLDDDEAALTVGDLFAGMSEGAFHDRARVTKEADHRFATISRSLAAIDRARGGVWGARPPESR